MDVPRLPSASARHPLPGRKYATLRVFARFRSAPTASQLLKYRLSIARPVRCCRRLFLTPIVLETTAAVVRKTVEAALHDHGVWPVAALVVFFHASSGD